MLQTLRGYALERLERSGEEDHVRRRHAEWFVALLQAAGIGTYVDVDMGQIKVVFGAELENFRAALEWAQRAMEMETVARLAAPLAHGWSVEGRLKRNRPVARSRAERSAEYPLSLQAKVLLAACELACARGAYGER